MTKSKDWKDEIMEQGDDIALSYPFVAEVTKTITMKNKLTKHELQYLVKKPKVQTTHM
jgi:hypothetical protein